MTSAGTPGSLQNPPYEDAMRQIGFIVGTGRCGTTILAQVLNSHSKICVPHELQFICGIGNGDRLYEKYQSGEALRYAADDFIGLIRERCPYHFERYFDYKRHFHSLGYPQADLAQVLTGLFDHICFSFGKEIFMEQTPWYGQRLDALQELFPHMKVIHVIRDGRDVALSFSRTPWWSKDIGKNLEQWEKEVNVIHDFVAGHANVCIEIRYEDLVSNPAGQLAKIMGLLNVEYEDDMMVPGKMIDYSSFFKGNMSKYQSIENKSWQENKHAVFFPESINAWKKCGAFDFSCLPDSVAATLEKFHYAV